MRILLTTLNSKYVHSNLALKYLYTVVAGENSHVELREFTINNDPGYIEFMESLFTGEQISDTFRLILHEKTHFLWKYLCAFLSIYG